MLLSIHLCLNTRVFVLFLCAADFPTVTITASVLSEHTKAESR